MYKMQTTIIYEPLCSLELCGFEAVPVCPERYGDAPVLMTQSDGTEIFWMRGDAEGIIRRYEPNGRLTLWYRKPTLADAVAYLGKGGYFKFNTDGSVEARWYGHNYFWRGDDVGNQYIPYGEVEVAHHCGEDRAYRFYTDCPGAPSCNYKGDLGSCSCKECRRLLGEDEYSEGGEACRNCDFDIRCSSELEHEGFCSRDCKVEYYHAL